MVTDAASKANKESEVEHKVINKDTARLSSVAIDQNPMATQKKHELEEEDRASDLQPTADDEEETEFSTQLLSQLDHCRANNDAVAYQRVYREIRNCSASSSNRGNVRNG